MVFTLSKKKRENKMKRDMIMLALFAVIALGACVTGVVVHSAKAVSSSLDYGEHTMTKEEMNYFLDRVHYGSKP
jgi:flagellar basal body-associated protein FliL